MLRPFITTSNIQDAKIKALTGLYFWQQSAEPQVPTDDDDDDAATIIFEPPYVNTFVPSFLFDAPPNENEIPPAYRPSDEPWPSDSEDNAVPSTSSQHYELTEGGEIRKRQKAQEQEVNIFKLLLLLLLLFIINLIFILENIKKSQTIRRRYYFGKNAKAGKRKASGKSYIFLLRAIYFKLIFFFFTGCKRR
jgi:hypothetical protein